MSECESPWHAGLTVDHLFLDCPARKRGEKELRNCGWWNAGTHGNHLHPSIDPHAGDVCGICLHRHNQREHKETA